MNKYKGQKFLICQPILGDLNGSTIVTLEICEYLKKEGANVSVFSYYIDNPAKTLFEEVGVHLIDYKEDKKLKTAQFDYVWIHSQTVPPSIIEDLKEQKQPKAKFIFLHMAAVFYIPDERPYIYQLEQKISDKTLFISEEVEEVNRPFFTKELDCAYFRNPAPKEFVFQRRPSQACKKVLMVSSHPPKEIIEARDLARRRGIEIELIGEGQQQYHRITPADIKRYDAVITIGKTVQYCFVSGTPVYVYDMHGGPGWLNRKNFSKAKEKNFSGRGFSPKTADQIVNELVSGYDEAQKFYADMTEEFRKEYELESVIDDVLASTKKRKTEPFTEDYVLAVKESLMLTSIRFNLHLEMKWFKEQNTKLKEQGEKLTEQNKKLEAEVKRANDTIKEITSARSYRAMVKIMRVIHRKK